MKELATIATGINWYKRPPNAQYGIGKIETYDNAASFLSKRGDFAKFLSGHIGNNPGRTLEIAAGTGLVSQVLKDKIPEVVFTDISLPAIQILQKRVGREAEISQADFFNLPFLSNSFDTVVNVGGYRYVPPKMMQKFWDEMKRVVTLEGRIFISQFYPRGIPLQGNDINHDKSYIENDFSLQSVRRYNATIDVGPLKIKSGVYRSFEFALKNNY